MIGAEIGKAEMVGNAHDAVPWIADLMFALFRAPSEVKCVYCDAEAISAERRICAKCNSASTLDDLKAVIRPEKS